MKTFSIEEIKNYILSQDSLGDVLYNLSEEKIKKANKKISFTLQEIMDGGCWEEFCKDYGVSVYAVNGGGGDVSYDLLISDAKKFNLL